jgi:surface protein
MKIILQEVKEKIQKIYNSMEICYKINNDILNKFDINKRNYYDFQNINNIEKNLQLIEIDKITNLNSSVVNILKNLGIILTKMTQNLKESEDSETESFKINEEKIYIKKNKLYKTNTEFIIQYKIDQTCKKIKIFGKNFVENNSENFVFIYDNDEYKLTEYLEIGKNKNIDKDILEIKLQVIKNNITNLSYMFDECTSLYSLLNICFLDTSNVTNMSGMFLGCKSLNYLSDISKWNTSNVESMNGMFNGCTSLSFLPDISVWDVSNVIDMSFMFSGCKSISNFPDFSKWDVSKVKNFEMMFRNCTGNYKITDKLNIK